MLDDYLRDEAALPPYPGGCSRMVDKWIRLQTGFSALANFGRDFSTQEEVDAWLSEPGGIAVAVNRVLRTGGFAKTRAPIKGDVGLVFHAPTGAAPRLCMAIHAGIAWVSRDDSGIMAIPLDKLWKAWRIA